jgi:hypothetical protein
MSWFNAGLELEKQNACALAPQLEVLGLSTNQFPHIVDMVPLSVFEAAPQSAISV